MSLLCIVLRKDYLLFSSDTRLVMTNGKTKDDFPKIQKWNRTTIFGAGGDVESNRLLFSDFLNEDWTPNTKAKEMSYPEIRNCIIGKYKQVKNEKGFHVFSCIGGYDGKKLSCIKILCDQVSGQDECSEVLIGDNIRQLGVIDSGIGARNIFEELEEKKKRELGNQNLTMRQYKNIFKDCLNIVSEIDSSVSNISLFESIRLSDVIKEVQ